jgi:hypothetical protein
VAQARRLFRQCSIFPQDHELSVSSEPVRGGAENFVPGLECCDVLTHGGHFTGEFPAGNRMSRLGESREQTGKKIIPLAKGAIHGSDGRGAHLHENLTVAGSRRFQVFHLEDVR